MDARAVPELRPRTEDFGGCRCRRVLLIGDAAATDPVCSLLPRRELVDLALKSADDTRFSPNKEIAPRLTVRTPERIKSEVHAMMVEETNLVRLTAGTSYSN